MLIDGQTPEQYVLNEGWEALKKLNILPVAKSLVVDLVETLHYPHDKVEGLWVIDEQHLAIINDDYGFTETDGILEQKYLDAEKNVIDCNTLYVIGQLNLAP
ncbi:esterase-like activity of phytase family protein [Acinetobacter sp. YH12052]|uniref:esterase-like activity of phytase family protein n=1 Tax=Acinetobacter sp. YH12052 TaxID=2601055 RepID=UPI00211DE636|nr:esterase-like activity of phytase family protein [Acinetobacter sp. YH12052]